MWPSLVCSWIAGMAWSGSRIMPIAPKANVFCSFIAIRPTRIAPSYERFPFTVRLASSRAVCSQVPCSRSISRRHSEHGSFQGCGLPNDEVGVYLVLMLTRRPSTGRDEPTGGRRGDRNQNSPFCYPGGQDCTHREHKRTLVRQRPCDCVVQPDQRQFSTTRRSRMQ